jgi:hypothetical protein
LGIIFNQDLTWHNQVAKLCRGVFFTLRRLWMFVHFTSPETRRKLVISRYQHITDHANKILRYSLDVYYSLRICCTLYRLIGSGRPGYLFDELQFGRSARLLNLIVLSHCTTARASSFFVQGAILWNNLPPTVRRVSSLRGLRNERLSCLRRSAVTGNV